MSASRLAESAFALVRRLWDRHRWSVPLSIGSAISFARLASELSEGDVDALDRGLQHAVRPWRGSLDGVMLALTRGGDIRPMTLLAACVLIVLAAKRRWREARYLVLAAGGALVLNTILKALFHRARPGAELVYLLATPVSPSFPSGHAMGTTGVIGCIIVILHVVGAPGVVRWAAIILGSAITFGVGLSRVYFGMHYPSDVLGGFLAAAAWVSAVTGWIYPRLLAVTPARAAALKPPATLPSRRAVRAVGDCMG